MNTETADSLSGASQTPPAPSILMGIQYVKSVEFQVLGAPAIYSRVTERPHLGVSVDVRAHQMGENQPNFEVELILRCQGHLPAQREGEEIVPLFDVNLIYAGIFTLQHATAETFETLLLIEAPGFYTRPPATCWPRCAVKQVSCQLSCSRLILQHCGETAALWAKSNIQAP